MDIKCFVTLASQAVPGVEFDIARMSFGRRLELMTQIRELSQRREFLDASAETAGRMESALLSMRIDQIYLRWGFRELRGLTIEGQALTPDSLWAQAPEALTREILQAIRAEAGLAEDERKN